MNEVPAWSSWVVSACVGSLAAMVFLGPFLNETGTALLMTVFVFSLVAGVIAGIQIAVATRSGERTARRSANEDRIYAEAHKAALAAGATAREAYVAARKAIGKEP